MKKLYSIENGQLVEAQAEPAKKKVLTPEEGRTILGLSRNTFMSLLYSGQIRAVKAGKRWLIPAGAIDDFLNGRGA
ncbi:MAG: helix-turn-helix domain-containing protein [Veillonellales bacterium]